MEKLFISNLNIETFVGWWFSAAAIKRKVLPECKQYPVLPLPPLSLSRTLVPKCPADFSVKEFKQQFESSVRIAVERKIKQGSVHKDGRRLFMEDLTFLTACHCIIVDGVCITSNLKLRTNQFLGADRLPYFPLLTELPL